MMSGERIFKKLFLQEERDFGEISREPWLHYKLFRIAIIAVMIIVTHFYSFPQSFLNKDLRALYPV